MVNIELVGICLGFSMVYRMSLLDVPSKSYGQFTIGCSGWVLQWGWLGLCSIISVLGPWTYEIPLHVGPFLAAA